MTKIRGMEFQRWIVGTPTKYSPTDESFLRTATDAGFEPFTHVGGLFGAQSDHRAVHIIHRGRGRKWEIIFLEQDKDVVTTMTTDLEQMTSNDTKLAVRTFAHREGGFSSVRSGMTPQTGNYWITWQTLSSDAFAITRISTVTTSRKTYCVPTRAREKSSKSRVKRWGHCTLMGTVRLNGSVNTHYSELLSRWTFREARSL